MKKLLLLAIPALFLAVSCQPKTEPQALDLVPESNFDTELNGQKIALFTLKNSNGAAVQITNYGGRVVSLWVPDREGVFRDVVQGLESIQAYMEPSAGNQGATVGRYANRIEDRKFTLDGKEYLLAGHPDVETPAGAIVDFNRAPFVPRAYANEKGEQALELKYRSPDGEAGFPGNVDVTVTFTLTNDNALKIHYQATTDAPTILSMTNHAFFNLRGEGNGDILDHELYVNADYFLVLKEGTLPTGEIAPVEGTPMDFRSPQRIDARIDEPFPSLQIGGGYDQCYVLNLENDGITQVASMREPEFGIVLDVYTDQPGMQLYSGNNLTNLVGKKGHVYSKRTGVCLETMYFPNSPMHDNFPSTVLRPGETYDQTCIYKFSVK